MKPEMKQYAVWNEEGFWNTFSELEDAVAEHGDAVIHEATYRPLGQYVLKVERKVTLRKKRLHFGPKNK